MTAASSPGGHWRQRLRRVPGLRPIYRAIRAGWWRLKDSADDGWWRLIGALPMGNRSRRRVSAVWADAARQRDRIHKGEGTLWLDSPQVLRNYVFPQFGGKHWYQYVADRYCAGPRQLGLSLCCGDGEVERNLLRFGICRSCEGIDLSPEAIELCRQAAAAAGLDLTYRTGDVERLRLPPDTYDVIVVWMALHHLRRLGHVFREIRRGLKPDGILIVNEYVGPSRFQVPDRQVALVNSLLCSLPEELRRRPPGSGIKERFARPRLVEVIRHDPSEAVSSHRILPELSRHFTTVEQVSYGGTLLQWLLEGIVQNFREDEPSHRGHLERLYCAEREVLASGAFPSDFAFVIARRRLQ